MTEGFAGAEAPLPFGVYVHWPFCAAKCPYCDFNSHVRHGGVDQKRFAAALATEIRSTAERAPGRAPSGVPPIGSCRLGLAQQGRPEGGPTVPDPH